MCRMNQEAPCMVCLLMCLLIEAPLAMNVKISHLFQGAPHSDVEFYTVYLNFVNSRNHEAYVPIAVACIFIGIVGNVCFFFFFGNPASAVYMTRDALYLRRLAGVDMIICVLVIPYSMLFEAKLIESTIMCKTMEYTRHVLTCISHLTLMSYSIEFSEPDDYVLANKRMNRSMLIIVLFACFISTPVLFIFEVGSTNDFSYLLDRNASKVSTLMEFPQTQMTSGSTPVRPASGRFSYVEPNFCHMLLNYDGTTKYYTAVKTLEALHLMSFGFVLFLAMILVMSRFMQFMEENPLIGRESMFINAIEIDNPELSKKLERMSINERRLSRRSKRSHKYSDFGALKLTERSSQGISDSKNLNNNLSGNSDVFSDAGNSTVANELRSVSKQLSEASTSVDNYVQNPVAIEEVKEPITTVVPETKAIDIFSDSKNLNNDNAEVANEMRSESKQDTEVSTSVDKNMQIQIPVSSKEVERPSPILVQETKAFDTFKSILMPGRKGQKRTGNRQLSQDNKRKSRKSIEDYELVMQAGGRRRSSHKRRSIGSENEVSLVRFLCCCECVRSRGKHIKTVRESYKKALACIIVLDILIACATITLYLISGERSVALNLIHVKSVFSFYSISFFHKDLRRATWRFTVCGRRCL